MDLMARWLELRRIGLAAQNGLDLATDGKGNPFYWSSLYEGFLSTF